MERRKFIDFLELIKTTFKERMFKEIDLVNISTSENLHFEESILAIHILKKCVLPYQKELDLILRKVIPKKTHKKR